MTREKRHAFLKLRVFQPNGRLLWGFVYVSCGQFDQWSTSWFCCSLPVLWGLQVKPPFCQSGWSRLRAMLRSWLSRTFAFFILPNAAFLSYLQWCIVLCLFLLASFLVVSTWRVMFSVRNHLRDFWTTKCWCHTFPRCVLLLFAIHKLTTFPLILFFPPNLVLHTATVNLLKVAAMVATKFRGHTKLIGCMEKRKLESLASCKTDATIMDARCRLNTHHGVSAWGLKAVLFTIRFVNYTHSGPQVSKMWVLLFALLFFPLKITIWRWQTSDQNRMVVGILCDPVLWQ